MSEAHDMNNTEQPNDSGRAPSGAPDGVSGVRRWLSGLVFLALAVVTFVAGEDNRWVSIPAAVLAAVALIDFLRTGQRRASE